MIGQVWRYNEDICEGHIIGLDSQSYFFSAGDYKGSQLLEKGNMVDFTPEGKFAKEITLLTTTPGKL
jgi:hypothetical protein